MTPYYILIVTLCALLILSELRYFCACRQWIAERRDLYTRIQAGTLNDYAVHQPLLEPKRPITHEMPVEPSVEALTSLGADLGLTDTQIAAAASSYRQEME